jgi:HPt (histidine-containing phosphotransfer) domain-containing protein
MQNRRATGKDTMTELSPATRRESTPSLSVERPIDLVHLARMTLGERSLEREVLQLFDRQAAIMMGRMQAAPVAVVAALAHTLKGSARAIGAARVARAAELVELADTADAADVARALAVLGTATEEARTFIADLLRAN